MKPGANRYALDSEKRTNARRTAKSEKWPRLDTRNLCRETRGTALTCSRLMAPPSAIMMRTEGASVELTIEDIAGRAGVDLAYVRRLVDLGALGPEGDGYREKDAHVTALLHMWEHAGLSAESILAAAESGELSLDFLESPGWELPPRLDRTYRELAEERSMPVDLLQAIQRAMGFVPPEPDDLARPDDVVIADLVRVALDIGGSGDAIRRLFRVYADNLRRSRSRRRISTWSRSSVRAEALERASRS